MQINFPLFNNKLCVLGTNANKQQRLHQQRLHQLPMVVLPMLATATEEPRHDTKYVDTQAFVDRVLSSELCFDSLSYSSSYSSSRSPPNPSMRFRCSPSLVRRLLRPPASSSAQNRCQLPLPPPLPSPPTSLLQHHSTRDGR